MVRPRRDFENDILLELKFRAHCKNKSPDHFCDQKDLSNNLKMSLRDVGLNVHAMTEKGILEHEKVLVNIGAGKRKLKDKFTPVDPRRYQPEKMIKNYYNIIKHEFVSIEELGKKMKETPARYDVEMKPIHTEYEVPYIKSKTIVQIPTVSKRITVMTSKTNKKGDQILDKFCNEINLIFTVCDSFSYSQQIANIPNSEEINKAIYEIKEYAFRKTQSIINKVLKGLPYLQYHAIRSAIIPKIPILYHMMQQEKYSKL